MPPLLSRPPEEGETRNLEGGLARIRTLCDENFVTGSPFSRSNDIINDKISTFFIKRV